MRSHVDDRAREWADEFYLVNLVFFNLVLL